MIPYGRQEITEQDIKAVVEVLRSDFLTQGPKVPEFEAALCKIGGASHAVAVNSATSALHIACLALGIGPGDVVWTSPITFVASANCARLCGAEVNFVDIEPDTFNMSPLDLSQRLEAAKAVGRLPRAIIPVHMCGQSPNMREISKLAKAYGVAVIEDASHSIGATYANAPVGACQFSDVTVFSFHPVKIVTTCEGGAALTNDAELAVRMTELRSHGVTRDTTRMSKAPDGPWYYEQIGLGLNYRLTDIQAALGVSQLTRLDAYVTRRNELADRYDSLLANLQLDVPARQKESRSSFHLYVIRLKEASLRREVFEMLRVKGVGVNVHYIPVHMQPYYRGLGFSCGDFPIAEDYYSRAISLPLFQNLSESDQDYIVDVLASTINAVSSGTAAQILS